MKRTQRVRELAKEMYTIWNSMSQEERDEIVDQSEKYAVRFDSPIGSMISSLARLLQ